MILSVGCGREENVEAKRDPGPVVIRAAPVVTRQIQRVVESVGTLFPYDEVIVSAEVDGPVREVNVDLGDTVKEGQVLARISDEEQRYLVAQNEAQLRQSLERLGLKHENDKVADIRETPEVRRAQADLFDAEQRYKRVRELVDQNIGSRQELDAAGARYKAAQAEYDATLNQTRNLIQEVERFKAVLELQRKKLRDTVVRAPFNASVKERQVAVGQYVRANTPLFTLVKTDPIRLRIEIPERMAPWVKEGQVADVTVEAYPGRVFRGKIWRISPTVDESKRTFIVEALIQNPLGELKPGSYAKASVKTSKFEEVQLVPFSAVNYVLGSYKAYVVKDGTVEARDVKLGDRFGSDVEIDEGLKDGELVAITQVQRLDTGTRVRVADGPAEGSNSTE
ncbi:MAG TPA: efflux RND transporter periplasmic adaptor subunit [Bryobacteraceae bacterium]|nr:efflux RND transporter periplasmic adaptor subunit [Bryobacteraceae bacterium]HPU72274.1 efflux RND transporter periplasmic adaptor subunit [Bryobacteraceae bacterium]